MWADALLSAERGHLVRLGVWGLASLVIGLAGLLAVARRTPRPALVWHFALQTAAWGTIDLGLVVAGWGTIAPRDLNGYWGLREFLWLNLGLDVGYMAVGVTLAACGWAMGRRPGPVGAGLGVLAQGTALLVLDGWLVVLLNRLPVA